MCQARKLRHPAAGCKFRPASRTPHCRWPVNFCHWKVIWDSQNDEPLYAVNEAALHASLQRNRRALARRIFWRDVREIGIGLAYAAGILVFGWMSVLDDDDCWRRLLGTDGEATHRDLLALLVAAGLWLFSAGYQFVQRT